MSSLTFGTAARANALTARRFPLSPAEGWSALALLVLLCLTMAWSVDDASWVAGPRGQTGFLALAVVLSVGWGFLSAKVGWSRPLAHLLGATVAALAVPIMVGAVLLEGGGGPVEWFQATAGHSVDAYLDLTYSGKPLTQEVGHFLLVLGLLTWATGQFAGYVTFHHHRPLNAVIIVGVVLVANMALTVHDQLTYLVIYSLAALFLLIRFHSFDERTLWIRHRIGDAASLSGLYLKGGTVFIGVAVFASLFLTIAARSDPLSGMWAGADQSLIDLGRQIQRIFPAGGAGTKIQVIDFGGSAQITGVWVTDNTPILQIKTPDAGQYYWRAVAYDHFDGRAWSWSKAIETNVGSGSTLLTGSVDDPAGLEARRKATFSVTELTRYDPKAVFAPDTPTSLDVDSKLIKVGSSLAPPFGGVQADSGQYQVSALVPIDGRVDAKNGFTAHKLEVAGTDYPDSIRKVYLAPLDPGIVGPFTEDLLAAIKVAHPEAKNSPYDMARAITDYLLYEGDFHYRADVQDVACGRMSVSECFARYKQGYCEYYASLLAVLLRMEAIPARLAEGFLPGERNAAGIETIRKSASHAWVEVYFPGYGWYHFDPTGGSIGQDIPLVEGPVVSARPKTPRPVGSADTGDDRNRSIRPQSTNLTGGAGSIGGPGGGPLIVIGLLLAVVVGGVAFAAYRRGPRSASEPEAAWRGVVGLARRFGFAPRPNQTVFEYSAALGEVLPNARPDLQTVARAKVEVAYGRASLGDARMRSVRDAQRRLRVTLLRLVFHRRERRERRARRLRGG
jgi:transglutaminase-like putative cysteine protease